MMQFDSEKSHEIATSAAVAAFWLLAMTFKRVADMKSPGLTEHC